MDNQQLQEKIQSFIPEAEFEEERGYLNATIPSEKFYKLAKELRTSPDFQFDFLFCLTGVDWPEHMEVVYHLKSTQLNHSVVIKAKINTRKNPEIETVSDIWRTADFHEREVYDLFGIVFKNHPDLRRIFLDDDWEGYPMRKDYVDEVNIVDL